MFRVTPYNGVMYGIHTGTIVSLEADIEESDQDGGHFLSSGTGDGRRAKAEVPLERVLEPGTSPNTTSLLSYIPGNKPSAFLQLVRQTFKASVSVRCSSIFLRCHYPATRSALSHP